MSIDPSGTSDEGVTEQEARLRQLAASVPGIDPQAAAAAQQRQAQLTKPAGALGVLEDLSVQLAGVAGVCPPPVPERAVVAVFAGDHGVLAQGVSPWPQEVTAAMVGGICAGSAAVNVISRQVGATVVPVDVGVAGDLPEELPGLLRRRVRPGTADLTITEAMTRAEAVQAMLVGAEVARSVIAEHGAQVLLTGDMGIGNTTASAALIAAFTGAEPRTVTGRGTGVDHATLELKVKVIETALVQHAAAVESAVEDPVGVLAAMGGLEHAAIAGFILGAAEARVPVILDGVIAGSAALAAHALAPRARDACVAGHRSVEPGHTAALEHIGLRPLVDLDLRLGEGTGALLALPIVQSAARVLGEMATFEEAGIEA